MDVIQAIRWRRSIRDFNGKEIPPEKVDGLIEALILAPSAGNLQSRKFYFVKDGDLKNKIAQAALNQRFIASAPLVVVGCADGRIATKYGDRGVSLYCIQDVAVSLMSMMLMAASEGLGSVWVGAFHETGVSKALNMPENLRPVAIVPVGYPARIPESPPRMSKEEAVEFK